VRRLHFKIESIFVGKLLRNPDCQIREPGLVRNLNQLTKSCDMIKKEPTLLFCIFMDIIGYATYAVPVIGEVADVLWAPISAIIFFMSFGGWKGAFGGLFNFVEEMLPGTDFIPTFTITWLWKYFSSKQQVKSFNNVISLDK
jgi:hypothetical protein